MKLKKIRIDRVGKLLTLFAFAYSCLFNSHLNATTTYIPNGNEYNISGQLVGDQIGTSISIGSNGGFVVWQDNSSDPFGYGVSTHRLDSSGNPIGSSIRINSILEGDQEKPHVGVMPNGGAYFVWEGGASGFHRVYYRVMNPQGLFIEKEKLITSANSGEQTEPSLVVLKDGSAVVAWTDYLADGSYKGVSARVISENGQSLGEPFRLNQFNKGNQHKVKVAALPEGGFVAIWVSDQQQSQNSLDIVGRIFSAKGEALSDEKILSPEGINANPDVAVTGDSVAVAWEKLNLENKQDRWDIAVRSFRLNFEPLSDTSLANLRLKGDQIAPKIEGGNSGAMLVWNSLGQDKSREGVLARFIDSTGRLSASEIIVNTYQDHSQIHPTLSNSQGKYIVAWSTPRIGKSGFDIVAQRFVAKDAQEELLPKIADIFVNPISQTEMFVSWPKMNGMNISHYELYIGDQVNPKIFSNNYVLWPGLRPGSEYAFRVAYIAEDGRRSEISSYGFNKTWGKDYNNDELPDDWQLIYFGSERNNWPGPEQDSDGDGATNQEEFLAGTDPSDASDKLTVELLNLEDGQRLQWNAKPGAVYQLQNSNNLNGSWINVGEPVLASESETGISLRSVGDVNFYRIKKIR